MVPHFSLYIKAIKEAIQNEIFPNKTTKILKKPKNCTVEKQPINWGDIPEVITKKQLYRICHISKSTALYLIKSDKILCTDTGKKTRRYTIPKADALTYRRDA